MKKAYQAPRSLRLSCVTPAQVLCTSSFVVDGSKETDLILSEGKGGWSSDNWSDGE